MEDEKKVKLVIEIPEEQYSIILKTITGIREETRRNGYAENDVVSIGWTAIADGKVLPRGHGRLIDADEEIKCARKWIEHPDKYISQRNKDFIYYLGKAETVIEADV